MPSRSPHDLHPLLQKAFAMAKLEWLERYPTRAIPILTTTHRPPQEQDALYAQGRSKPGPKVTNARAGQSPHNFLPALAFDVAFQTKGRTLDWSRALFQDFAALLLPHFGQAITWGGSFRSFLDLPHFELSSWRTIITRRSLYQLESPYMRDGFVQQIQLAAAAELGEHITADGVFGPGTEALIKRFQHVKGLVADGIVGPHTLKVLGLA